MGSKFLCSCASSVPWLIEEYAAYVELDISMAAFLYSNAPARSFCWLSFRHSMKCQQLEAAMLASTHVLTAMICPSETRQLAAYPQKAVELDNSAWRTTPVRFY